MLLFVTRPRAYVVLTAAVSRKLYEATELRRQSTVAVAADAWINKDRLLRFIFLEGAIIRPNIIPANHYTRPIAGIIMLYTILVCMKAMCFTCNNNHMLLISSFEMTFFSTMLLVTGREPMLC